MKAVPKNTVAVTDKKVKRIKGQSRSAEHRDNVRHASRKNTDSDVPEYRVRRSATRETQRDEQVVISRSNGNKNGTKRIILPDEKIEELNLEEQARVIRRTDSGGMTGIERAAAAKARQEREERRRREE